MDRSFRARGERESRRLGELAEERRRLYLEKRREAVALGAAAAVADAAARAARVSGRPASYIIPGSLCALDVHVMSVTRFECKVAVEMINADLGRRRLQGQRPTGEVDAVKRNAMDQLLELVRYLFLEPGVKAAEVRLARTEVIALRQLSLLRLQSWLNDPFDNPFMGVEEQAALLTWYDLCTPPDIGVEVEDPLFAGQRRYVLPKAG